jgi:hypothetical protein
VLPLPAPRSGERDARRRAATRATALRAGERRSLPREAGGGRRVFAPRGRSTIHNGMAAALDSPRTVRIVSMTILFHEPYSN